MKGQPLPPVIQNYADRLEKRKAGSKPQSHVLPELVGAPADYLEQIKGLRSLVDGPDILAEMLAHALADLKISLVDKVAEAAAAEQKKLDDEAAERAKEAEAERLRLAEQRDALEGEKTEKQNDTE